MQFGQRIGFHLISIVFDKERSSLFSMEYGAH